MEFEKLGCILHKRWIAEDGSSDFILGVWAEDNSIYKIKVPYKLRSSLIYIQNILSDKYNGIINLRDTLRKMENNFKEMLK